MPSEVFFVLNFRGESIESGSLDINSSTTILAQVCEFDQRNCPNVKVSALNLECILLG